MSAAKQGEAPVLVVSAVHDVGVVGGFGDEAVDGVVGLRVVAVTSTPHVVAPPPPPASLLAARDLLGPGADAAAFPRYVLLTVAPKDDDDADAPPEPPLKLALRRVVVATNRRPTLGSHGADFAPTLDAPGSPGSPEAAAAGSFGLGVSAKAREAPERERDGLHWGLATVGVDADGPAAPCDVGAYAAPERKTRIRRTVAATPRGASEATVLAAATPRGAS